MNVVDIYVFVNTNKDADYIAYFDEEDILIIESTSDKKKSKNDDAPAKG
ncbi:hypothetical protein [Methanolobus vulcani]|nr:hypothetical protein [Methanolobus vulcani]